MPEFDITDRPAAGTECFDCRKLGHYCPAKGMRGDYALCAPCGTGESCEQMRSIERMHAGVGEFEEFEAKRAPAECRTIAIAEADRIVAEAAPVATDWTLKATLNPENLRKGLKSGDRAPIAPNTYRQRRVAKVKVAKARVVKDRKPRRVASEGRAKPVEAVMAEKMELEAAKTKAVEMADQGVTNIESIAKTTGWSWYCVRNWLRDAGKMPVKAVGAKSPKLVKKAKGAKSAVVKNSATPPSPVAVAATVGVQLSERSLDAFWAKCSLVEKARAFSAMFEAR